MYLDYNRIHDEFSWEELRHLSGALGFPKNIFETNMPPEFMSSGPSISNKDLMKCIDERCFNVDLHYTVNLKSGAYNATCLKKAVEFISKRFLSFKDLLGVRLAFESYEEYDQKGMKIDELTFLRALKMCGRVISPKKLMHKVKYLKSSYQEPGRIQLFEFLNLLTLCEWSEKYQITDDLNSPVEKTWTRLYKIDNFRQFTTPRDKKLWRHLNNEYKDKELRYNKPELKSHEFVENPLKSEEFRTQVKICNQRYEMLNRNLKNSTKQVQLAKGGFSCTRPKSVVSTTDIERRLKSLSPPTFRSTSSRPVSGRPPTPESTLTTERRKSAEPKKFKRHQRPMSSPPVVSKQSAKDSRKKVDDVQFEICTENQRWTAYYLESISSRLPNYHDVLRRMRKPPAAPGIKKFYRKERPSRTVIDKLANPDTRPSTAHVERCDALVHGVGSDKHSVMLTNQARKIRSRSAPVMSSSKRVKSTSTSTSKRRARYSALLETLMAEYGYVSDSDSCDEPAAIVVEEVTPEEKDVAVEETTVVLPESPESSCASECEEEEEIEEDVSENDDLLQPLTKEKFLEDRAKYKEEKRLKIEKFLSDSGYYRIFIEDSAKGISVSEDEKEAQEPQEIVNKAVEAPIATEAPSELELQIRSFKNIRIPHDVLLFEETEDIYEKRRRLSSLKRISQRFPLEDRRWFMRMARDQETKSTHAF